MGLHKVRLYNWENGKLTWKDIWFHTLEVAEEFIEQIKCDTWKLFNSDGINIKGGDGKKSDDDDCHKKHHKHKKHRHHHHDDYCDDDCDDDCDCDDYDDDDCGS